MFVDLQSLINPRLTGLYFNFSFKSDPPYNYIKRKYIMELLVSIWIYLKADLKLITALLYLHISED